MKYSSTQSDSRSNGQRNIHMPRRYTHPIRVRITQSDDADKTVQEYKLNAPFSIGYGDHCEVKLPKGEGPDRLFEFAPMENSSAISIPLEQAIERGGFDIYVDGESVSDSKVEIEPGSSVKIFDKECKQEVELSVEAMQHWKSHVRPLYWISGLLLALMCIAGYVVFKNFQSTEERLEETESRLTKTETSLSDKNVQLEEIVKQFDSRQLKIEHSLEEITAFQNSETAQIRNDFSSQLKAINESTQQSLSSIAESDRSAREQLLTDARNEIAALEAEMSDRLITTTEQIKTAQRDLFVLNTARIESLEQASTLFKDILLESQKSVIYIRTTYSVESEMTDKRAEMESFGTGFTIDSNGLSIAPQHVLKPWLYDDNMLAMQEIGMLNIVEGSVTYTIWTSEEQVIEQQETTDELHYQTETAFSSDKDIRGVTVLYSPLPETAPTVMASVIGAVTIDKPLVGHTDITMLQLIDFEREFAALSISENADNVEPMDEIVLVGYPLSRLHDGKSIPQGVKGFVRRQTQYLLELDTALHPGSSGAPVLNRASNVIGMAVALINSDTYGVAVPASYLNKAIKHARDQINQIKESLIKLNCYSGELDGTLDKKMWQAMQKPECRLEQTHRSITQD